MRTVLYLLRHGATEAELAWPARLQGRRHNPPLARLGVRQAELTRDFLAVRPIDHCYCSPLLRAVQTASIIAAPHGLAPQPLDDLIECDVGNWEGLDRQAIRSLDAEGSRRASRALAELLSVHAGQSILVVAHHVVNRTYLAGLLGLPLDQARQVTLDNCGISVVAREGERAAVTTLNASFHLQGLAA